MRARLAAQVSYTRPLSPRRLFVLDRKYDPSELTSSTNSPVTRHVNDAGAGRRYIRDISVIQYSRKHPLIPSLYLQDCPLLSYLYESRMRNRCEIERYEMKRYGPDKDTSNFIFVHDPSQRNKDVAYLICRCMAWYEFWCIQLLSPAPCCLFPFQHIYQLDSIITSCSSQM